MDKHDTSRQPLLVVHLIYRLDVGGLESLLVDCINGMPASAYRHAVVCLCGYSDFATRITRPGVDIYSLDKPPGLGLGAHVRLWKLLRRLRLTVEKLTGNRFNIATAQEGGEPEFMLVNDSHDGSCWLWDYEHGRSFLEAGEPVTYRPGDNEDLLEDDPGRGPKLLGP